MSEFNFKSQICTDKNQSKRLLALGLKKETADICYTLLGGHDESLRMLVAKPCFYHNDIPAWSLHRLVSMIEEDFQSNGRFFCLPMFGFDKSDNLYDNIIDAYEWLIKEGYFNKEYLV